MSKRSRAAVIIATVITVAGGVFGAVSIWKSMTEVNKVYLPIVMGGYSTSLQYGPKGTGGLSNLIDNAYYGWNVGDQDKDLVRMIWCTSDEWMAARGHEIVPAAQADFDAGMRGRVWLVFNEPATNYDQCGSQHIGTNLVSDAPRLAASTYHDVYTIIKMADPHARVFVGGMTNIGVQGTAQWWWAEFIDEMNDQGWVSEVEGVHIHAYPRWATYCADPFSGGWPQNGDWCMSGVFTALGEWYDSYHVGLGLANLPLWITEAGCAPYVTELAQYGNDAWGYCLNNVMEPMQAWFDAQSNYDALYWFISAPWQGGGEHWWPTALVKDDSLTPLGEAWETWHP